MKPLQSGGALRYSHKKPEGCHTEKRKKRWGGTKSLLPHAGRQKKKKAESPNPRPLDRMQERSCHRLCLGKCAARRLPPRSLSCEYPLLPTSQTPLSSARKRPHGDTLLSGGRLCPGLPVFGVHRQEAGQICRNQVQVLFLCRSRDLQCILLLYDFRG